jgi:phage terminase large subunit
MADQYSYHPREAFIPLHTRTQRWAVVIAHRRAGKTVSLLNDIIVRALHKRQDGMRDQYAYMAPFQNQARAVAWEYVKAFTACFAKCPGYSISEMNLTVTLPDPTNVNKKGASIMLLGAENAEKLRGIFLSGVVIDEFQDIAPYVWDTILRPALADRGGWAVFSGTVKGHDNPLWETYEAAAADPANWIRLLIKASESGILPPEELEDLRRGMTPEAYAAEMECDPAATVTGRILLPYIRIEQVTKVPWQPDGGPVISAWDLGMSDSTAIWTAQNVGKELHLLDYYEESGAGLAHFVEYLRKLEYSKHFGAHLMPHDTNVRELGSGVSRLETLRNMGVRNVKIVPKLPKSQQIDAARMLLSRSWFDKERCAKGLRALRGYQFSYDQKRQCFSQSPLHDKASNGSDAWQQLAVGLRRAGTHIENNPGVFGMSDGIEDVFIDDAPVAEPWQDSTGIFG